MTKKKLIKLTLILSIVALNIPKEIIATEEYNKKGNTRMTEKPPENEELTEEGNKQQQLCANPKYERVSTGTSIGYNISKIEWNMVSQLFDKFDNTLLKINEPLSGTAIGVTLSENRKIYWSCVKKSSYYVLYPKSDSYTPSAANCTIKTTTSNKFDEVLTATPLRQVIDADGKVTQPNNKTSKTCNCYPKQDEEGHQYYYSNGKCVATWTEKVACTSSSICTEETEIADAFEDLKKDLKETTTPSYKMIIEDSNDANCKGSTCNLEVPVVDDFINTEPTSPLLYNVYYEFYGTCLNATTGKVRYLDSELETCESDEVLIENYIDTVTGENTHWHAFIPLNQKSNDTYNIKATSDKTLATSECQTYIEQNEDYYDTLIAANNDTLEKEPALAMAQITAANGCKKAFIFEVKVQQKFYNEEEKETDKLIFQGFNFYYKPIDITKPFSSTFDFTDSYWTEEDVEEKITSTAFSEKNLEYVAENINAKEIKNINKNSTYTDWRNMNPNGTSSLIGTDNLITRIKKYDGYELGAGPQVKIVDGVATYIKEGEASWNGHMLESD